MYSNYKHAIHEVSRQCLISILTLPQFYYACANRTVVMKCIKWACSGDFVYLMCQFSCFILDFDEVKYLRFIPKVVRQI